MNGKVVVMQYARKLRKGDKVAIVSLSSGMLGEEFCSHNIEIGVKRLKEYGLMVITYMAKAITLRLTVSHCFGIPD